MVYSLAYRKKTEKQKNQKKYKKNKKLHFLHILHLHIEIFLFPTLENNICA